MTRVMISTQLTSMARPDTLRVRKKKYSGLMSSRMSCRLPLRRRMSVNPQAKTSLRIWENRSTRYAPLKRVACCPRQNTQAMIAATESSEGARGHGALRDDRQDGGLVGGRGLGLFEQVLHAGVEHAGEGLGMEP